jgi:hypothetical protein
VTDGGPGRTPASGESPDVLKRLYANRLSKNGAYRNRIWAVHAAEFFSPWIATDATVLDLGSGYGEFINNVRAGAGTPWT